MQVLAAVQLMIALFAACCGSAWAQAYPNKPIRFVTGYAAGGSPDVVGRIIGNKLTEAWGQQILIDNRPGASGNIGAEQVAKAMPDGYTLLIATANEISINPHLQKSLPFNPDRDFAPVVMAVQNELVLSVHPSIPANNVRELVAYAKANPGKISYASLGLGSIHYLGIEWLKNLADIDMVHIPYKGSSQLLPDLLSGRVQLSFTGIPAAMPHVKLGKLRAIAIGAVKPLVVMPGISPINETFPGFEAGSVFGFLAPADTPRDIVMKLNTEINRILALPDVIELLSGQGLYPIGGTPEQHAARMKSDSVKWGKVIKDIGLKPTE